MQPNGSLNGENGLSKKPPYYLIAGENLQPVLHTNFPTINSAVHSLRWVGRVMWPTALMLLIFGFGWMVWDHSRPPWRFNSAKLEPTEVTLQDVISEKAITVCKDGVWFWSVPYAETFQSWTPVDESGRMIGDTIPANKHVVKLPAVPVSYPLHVSNCRAKESDGTPALQLDPRMKPGRWMLTIETWAYPYGRWWPIHGHEEMQAKAYLIVR